MCKKYKYFEYLSLVFLCFSSVLLIGMHQYWGYIFLFLGIIVTLFCKKDFLQHILLLYGSLVILTFTDIDTNISYIHMFSMGIYLFFIIFLPWYISCSVYKTSIVEFKFNFYQKWTQKQKLYILFCMIASYILIPFYLIHSGAYTNWSVTLDLSHITRLFIGTNALGIWDELFFINVVFAILRRYFSFWTSNIAQGFLFTSFLFELGFTGWGPLIIYPFALIQGFIYERTQSLFYIITIHLTLDFILFLALIWSYYPEALDIFLL